VALLGGCEDPPPPPAQGAFLLGIRTVLPVDPDPVLSGGMNETLAGLDGLRAKIVRVDVVHRTDAADPSTERVITVEAATHDILFQGDLQEIAPRQIGFFNVPVGFVFQVRLIVAEATITLSGTEHTVTVPSGAQTGFKVEPIDGVPFEIKDDERTAARIVFEPFNQLIHNRGQGFMMKPVLLAEHVTLEELSPILLDRIVVRFKNGVSAASIASVNASIGATVIDFDGPTNYYLLRLPTSISLEGALSFYTGRSDVAFTLPDTVIYDRQVIPCDPQFQNPGPFTQVNAPQAWAVTTGNRTAVLAVIDNGFDLTNPDMVANYFINQGELPAGLVDTDGDGLITFVDLTAPANTVPCTNVFGAGAGAGCDFDGDGVVTPRDLVDGNAAVLFGFEDNVDNDGNLRTDDLVGWDFANTDNLPQNPGNAGCLGSHGVGVAGVMAAIGAPPPVAPAVCASGLVAGMNWVGRLLPIQQGGIGGDINTSSRATAYLAIRYAAALGADAINASWGITYAQNSDPGCNLSIPNLGDKYDDLLPLVAQEAMSLALGSSLLIAAVDNCPQNDDAANLFDWPPELNQPNVVAVGAIQTNVAPATLAAFSAFGPNSVDIVAPGTNHTLLNVAVGTNPGCQGTSFAAPMVTGTVGLVLTNNPGIQGNAAAVLCRLFNGATLGAGLAGQIGGGGRVLNVTGAVMNAGGCVP